MSLGLTRFWRRITGEGERTVAVPTNTQFLVHMSGYAWAADWPPGVSGRRVLDVACGEGFGSRYFAEHGARVTGADLSEEALAVARKQCEGLRVTILKADAVHLPLPDASFDLIFSQDTIEHIPDDEGFLREMHRLLAPSGLFLMMTPHATAFDPRPANPHHVREYDKATLERLLLKSFTDLRWFGRRQTPLLKERERSMNLVRRWDPLGLRRWLVPTDVRHALGSLLCRLRGLPPLESMKTEEISYFEGVEDDGNLIVAARKPAG